MKKLLAILLAFSMLFAFAACGGSGDDETTTTTTEAVEDTDVAEESTDAAEDTTAASEEESTEDASAAEDTTAASEETSEDASAAENGETTTAAANAQLSKAEFVALLNADSAKIAKSGSYSAVRKCEYTTPIDVGGATSILNGIISAIDEGSDLNSVVGGFLGIGTTKGGKKDIDDDYQIKAMSLKESDLGSFSYSNGVYSFTLANATNPKKTGATPLSRFTNDFITHEEIVDGIASFTTAITVKETTVNYKSIKVSVTVSDGKITNIKYSYAFDAALALKAGITINGSGAAVTNTTYSSIKY